MKVVQKILSHGLLITFFVVVFFLYMYRSILLPQWFGSSADNSSGLESMADREDREDRPAPLVPQAGEGQQLKRRDVSKNIPLPVAPPAPVQGGRGLPSSASGLPPLVSDDEPVTDSGLPPLVVDEDTEPGLAGTPPPDAAEHAVTNGQEPAPVIDVQPAGTAPEQEPEPAAPPREDSGGVAEAAGPDGPDGETPPLPAGDDSLASAPEPAPPVTSDYQSQLGAARELFWKRDAAAAVYAYTELVRSYPDRPGGWGELGNLYISIGSKENAAEAYYQAIGLLIQQQRPGEARKMLDVMRSLDPVKADELEQWLEQAGN